MGEKRGSGQTAGLTRCSGVALLGCDLASLVLAGSNVARGQSAQAPVGAESASSSALSAHGIGTKVVVKDPQTPLRVLDQMTVSHRHHLYTVEQVNGPWLWVAADDGLSGWVRERDVVPLAHAVDYFTAVVRSFPLASGAYYMRGLVWYDLNQPEIASGDFTESAKIDFRNAWAYFHRGNIRKDQHDYDGAYDDYTEAIRLDQTNAGPTTTGAKPRTTSATSTRPSATTARRSAASRPTPRSS